MNEHCRTCKLPLIRPRPNQIFCSNKCAQEPRKETAESRFWKNVVKGEYPDDCWTWSASRIRGYGNLCINGATVYAHRLSWTLHFGEIPGGLEVCHNCPGGDNPSCVNPKHLFLGTHDQNMKDCKAKGRIVSRGGESQGSAKLTDEKVLEIWSLKGTMLQKDIAIKFGVRDTTISLIYARKAWKHVLSRVEARRMELQAAGQGLI